MISLEKLDAITERLQTIAMTNPTVSARILSILSRYRETRSRLVDQIAAHEEFEEELRELESHLDALSREGCRKV